MIDHVSIAVRDLAKSADFYERVLAPLGLSRMIERPGAVGFGKAYPELWLNARPSGPSAPEGTGSHVALRARSQEAVRAFHAAALAHGGRDEGGPGPRPAALTAYYGAFILDPEGNKLEAVNFPG
ncbi:MAG TPA: VOC family protein [Rhizomicrobium sp.]|nr:VOC family protein [Rhizomicrobium sp.]